MIFRTFQYNGTTTVVKSLILRSARSQLESVWGLKCPLCGKWFKVGDDCRILFLVQSTKFANTMVHTECINPCGGLVDACKKIEELFSEWTKLSGTWSPEIKTEE